MKIATFNLAVSKRLKELQFDEDGEVLSSELLFTEEIILPILDVNDVKSRESNNGMTLDKKIKLDGEEFLLNIFALYWIERAYETSGDGRAFRFEYQLKRGDGEIQSYYFRCLEGQHFFFSFSSESSYFKQANPTKSYLEFGLELRE
ncbi:MAG: hypothetical protein AABY64_11180 [Bdellovibrionota bacterium]